MLAAGCFRHEVAGRLHMICSKGSLPGSLERPHTMFAAETVGYSHRSLYPPRVCSSRAHLRVRGEQTSPRAPELKLRHKATVAGRVQYHLHALPLYFTSM